MDKATSITARHRASKDPKAFWHSVQMEQQTRDSCVAGTMYLHQTARKSVSPRPKGPEDTITGAWDILRVSKPCISHREASESQRYRPISAPAAALVVPIKSEYEHHLACAGALLEKDPELAKLPCTNKFMALLQSR